MFPKCNISHDWQRTVEPFVSRRGGSMKWGWHKRRCIRFNRARANGCRNISGARRVESIEPGISSTVCRTVERSGFDGSCSSESFIKQQSDLKLGLPRISRLWLVWQRAADPAV